MKRFWIPACFVIGIVMVATSLFYWGGLASHAEVGKFVSDNVAKYSFIAWVYCSSGASILPLIGLDAPATEYAAKHAGQAFSAVKATPYSAMAALYAATPGEIKFASYIGPLLLAIAAFAQVRKPQSFRTFNK
jgi:hypothetical protein